MKRFWIGSGLLSVLVATAFTLASCGGGGTTEAPKAADSGAAPAGGPAATPDMDNGGTITGKVTFEGTPPKMATLDTSANPVCAKAHATSPLKSEEVVVNPNGTLKNVFVWVSAGLPDKTWQVPTSAVEIDQNGCEYKPHVIALMAGQNLSIKNSDPTNHNIHPQPSVNQEFNESQAPGTPAITKTFPRQEIMIPVKCNVHNWMRSYINVVSHPFFAVTGDDGTYTIKGLPPGTYTIEIDHEKYGKQTQQVTVGAKESKTQDFTVKG
jgi:plastocyanin